MERFGCVSHRWFIAIVPDFFQSILASTAALQT